MNKLKNIIIPVSMMVLLIVLAGVSFANSQGNEMINYVQPIKGDIAEQLRISGKVQPKNTLDLGFEIPGKVAKIYVAVGDKVQKGDLLAELNPQEKNISYAQSISDRNVAQAQLEQAQKDRSAQKAKLRSVEKSSTANKYDEKAQKEMVNQSDANIRAKEALLKKADETVQNSRMQIDKNKLYSPIDGVVTKQDLEKGEIIPSYTPSISLMGDEMLEIQAYVSEIEVSKIFVGDKAKVKLDGNQVEELTATVSAIDPVETDVANISSYKVTFVPDFSNEKLKSGMMADLILNLGEDKDALIIPTQSIFEENGKPFVLEMIDNLQVRKEVQLGITDYAGNTEIMAGIGEDDRIISFN